MTIRLALLLLTALAFLAPQQSDALIQPPALPNSSTDLSPLVDVETPEYVAVLVETPEGFCWVLCRNDPVDNIDPLGLWGVQIGSVKIGVGDMTLAFGDIGVDVGDVSFSKGWSQGATIAANELTFGKYEFLDSEAQALISKGGVYQASAISSRIGRTALLAAGANVGMGALSSAAASGGSIGTAAQITRGAVQVASGVVAANSAGQNLGEASVDFQTGHGVQGTVKAGLGVLDAVSAVSGARTGLRDLSAAAPKVVNAINNALPTSLDPRAGSVLNPFVKNSPDPLTGEGYGVADPPVRLQGEWSDADFRAALRGRTPPGLGSPDIHHAGQMPGSAIHEVVPGLHQGNKALHPNRFNQGVTPEMRRQDRNLHWWYRAREQGADKLYPDEIYD